MTRLLVVAHEATRTGSPRVLLELLRRTLPDHDGEVAVRLLAEGPLADELRELGTTSPIGFRPQVALLNSAPSGAVALELDDDVRVVAYVHEEGEALERAHVHRLKSGLDGRRALRAWRAAAAAIGTGRQRAAALKRVADVFGAIGGVGARVRLQRSILVWQAESHAILLMRAAGSQSAKWGNRACSAAALRLWRRALWQLRLGSLAHAHALGWHAPYAPPLQLAHSSRYLGLARALRPWRDACARTRAFTAALERADSPRYVRLARALYTWWDACACTRPPSASRLQHIPRHGIARCASASSMLCDLRLRCAARRLAASWRSGRRVG